MISQIQSFRIEDLRKNCFQIKKSICLGTQKSELGLESSEYSLIGEYKFDDQYGIDTSKMKNDIINIPKVGPQQGGKGYSAFFDQQNTKNITTIKHIDDYNSEDFSLSFWIFLIQDNNTPGWKTIIHKGSNSQELTPSIMLWPNSRRLHIRLSTDNNWNEDFDSNGLLPLKRWTQINNNGDFHIGMDEWHSGPIFYMDNLKFYKSILKKSEIDALTYQPFSIFGSDSYARLGCLSCTYQEALNSCKNEYHLCTFSEIYAGAYQVARIQGWMRLSMYFWTRVDQTQGQFFEELKDPNVNKVGICCINKGY
ncbi:NLI interacting factor-like phosphatase family protein, putative [Ichthyophthirius multifiliis]|uniref:NLI interacting factor-like phosphatase family protein, putative n=1 Tax=Ichthyophthirius multifiliis TaxID=5932 RepID=G0QKB2_ICHMU|nr:NLI interacting factor-like phosphatase family protein, putative [Ichthyophthirius multifiliis]EGR34342.1 NLI interacting factor-like phosphatase family protein, putative [Ichthyophthirius multifiliis]|eukprot:XP_004039646.1 NLI interacting factor-like phosphatase family protein, putative [Ichthyophthirius multifiliis]